MFARAFHRLLAVARPAAQVLRRRLLSATKPVPASVMADTLADLVRTKPELIAENALLRQQLIIVRRSVKRPHCTATGRTLLALLAGRVRSWRQSLLIVQPDTLLRWHRNLFRCFWRRKSRATAPAHRPPIVPEIIALIREMAAANRTWGAERIRGELLKLHIHVAKATIACCERLLGSVRRECLDHLLILNEAHLLCVLQEYLAYYNSARPHQGLHQRIPDPPVSPANPTGTVCATPVLGGFHHSYARAA
jgi:hypothetical protein